MHCSPTTKQEEKFDERVINRRFDWLWKPIDEVGKEEHSSSTRPFCTMSSSSGRRGRRRTLLLKTIQQLEEWDTISDESVVLLGSSSSAASAAAASRDTFATLSENVKFRHFIKHRYIEPYYKNITQGNSSSDNGTGNYNGCSQDQMIYKLADYIRVEATLDCFNFVFYDKAAEQASDMTTPQPTSKNKDNSNAGGSSITSIQQSYEQLKCGPSLMLGRPDQNHIERVNQFIVNLFPSIEQDYDKDQRQTGEEEEAKEPTQRDISTSTCDTIDVGTNANAAVSVAAPTATTVVARDDGSSDNQDETKAAASQRATSPTSVVTATTTSATCAAAVTASAVTDVAIGNLSSGTNDDIPGTTSSLDLLDEKSNATGSEKDTSLLGGKDTKIIDANKAEDIDDDDGVPPDMVHSPVDSISESDDDVQEEGISSAIPGCDGSVAKKKAASGDIKAVDVRNGDQLDCRMVDSAATSINSHDEDDDLDAAIASALANAKSETQGDRRKAFGRSRKSTPKAAASVSAAAGTSIADTSDTVVLTPEELNARLDPIPNLEWLPASTGAKLSQEDDMRVYTIDDVDELLFDDLHVVRLNDVTKKLISKMKVAKINGGKVTGGPMWQKMEHGLFDLYGNKDKKYSLALQEELLKVVENLGYTRNRHLCDVSRLESHAGPPQRSHRDWKQHIRLGRLAKKHRPLSVLCPTTEEGMYLQVWNPCKLNNYGKIIHVKYGEMILYEATVIHGGNVGGLPCQRVHMYIVEDPKDGENTAAYIKDDGSKSKIADFISVIQLKGTVVPTIDEEKLEEAVRSEAVVEEEVVDEPSEGHATVAKEKTFKEAEVKQIVTSAELFARIVEEAMAETEDNGSGTRKSRRAVKRRRMS